MRKTIIQNNELNLGRERMNCSDVRMSEYRKSSGGLEQSPVIQTKYCQLFHWVYTVRFDTVDGISMQIYYGVMQISC